MYKMFNTKSSTYLENLINGNNRKYRDFIIKTQKTNFGNFEEDFQADDVDEEIQNSVNQLLNSMQNLDSSLKESVDFESMKKQIPLIKNESQKLYQYILQISEEVKSFTATQVSSVLNLIDEINESYNNVIQIKPADIQDPTSRTEMLKKVANVIKSFKLVYTKNILPSFISLQSLINSSTNDISISDTQKSKSVFENMQEFEGQQSNNPSSSPILTPPNSGQKSNNLTPTNDDEDEGEGEYAYGTPQQLDYQNPIIAWQEFLSPAKKGNNKAQLTQAQRKRYFNQFNSSLEAYIDLYQDTSGYINKDNLPNLGKIEWKEFARDADNYRFS